MLPYSEYNQNIKMFGVPPEHFAIGYVHNDNLPLGNIALQYVIQNNCRKIWWCFLMISCTFWRSTTNFLNSLKLSCGFKGEVRTWSNLILEERVKFSEQNSENLMKIGWKIRKLWHFEVSQIFRKHFLTSPYEYANEWVDDVIASQFSIHFVHRNDKNVIFQPWEC